MGRNEELEESIRELFYQNTEGEYWDFKEYPYFYTTYQLANFFISL